MIRNINNNQTSFGITSLTTNSSSATSSSSSKKNLINGNSSVTTVHNNNNNTLNSQSSHSQTTSSVPSSLDYGFSIYNKNIDFYESFKSTPSTTAKDVSSEKTVKMMMMQGKQENDVSSQIVVSNNNMIINNNNNNNTKIINSNQIFNKITNTPQTTTTTTTTTTKTLISDLNNLHNYSKSPNAIETKPNVQEMVHVKVEYDNNLYQNDDNNDDDLEDDDDDDLEDDTEQLTVKENAVKEESSGHEAECDDKTPDHHARRPMNAFLIFCKRHRSIVRDRHPNLENRSITKILGDWWANLDKEEKQCYTELAKMYKDAFFSANPNFKWYKLPAPPLRTLGAKPNSADALSPNKDYIFDYPTTVKSDTDINERDWHEKSLNQQSSEFFKHSSGGSVGGGNKIQQHQQKHKKGNTVGVFKLADETQMGGLSSLLTNVGDSTSPSEEGISHKEQSLQDALSETSNYIVETMSSSRTEPFTNMKNYAVKFQTKLKNSPNEISDAELAQKWKLSGQNFEPNTFLTYDEEYYNKKSSRSCKGKRYQEIMKSIAKNGSPNKRIKLKHTNSVTSAKQNGYPSSKSTDDNIQFNVDGKEGSSMDDQKVDDKSKIFDASDFDLEEKIKALPALSLDEYLARKRETKKTKKKIGGRAKINRTSKHDNKVNKNDLNNVSGSQKRKAPKGSITRRDVTTENNTEETKIINLPMTSAGTSAADLFTLAEVAVQTASIDKPIVQKF